VESQNIYGRRQKQEDDSKGCPSIHVIKEQGGQTQNIDKDIGVLVEGGIFIAGKEKRRN